ncbi:hypothetical protein BDP55DRAFT_179532 [Colletotrichum godetiae]|uniref:Secreted protein n=1 Tax=Colletotrichum godetiae TaxID=1209918 RepID=A0AAJ0EWW2_9PEZI|nr:uncharacterized protein BDP55DRAFT_179532 [Colletotrichum godetiae]KAK1674635.1 hypothetical protein BDP55DRAFT_179532 [Colletotrichum godetiae]
MFVLNTFLFYALVVNHLHDGFAISPHYVALSYGFTCVPPCLAPLRLLTPPIPTSLHSRCSPVTGHLRFASASLIVRAAGPFLLVAEGCPSSIKHAQRAL